MRVLIFWIGLDPPTSPTIPTSGAGNKSGIGRSGWTGWTGAFGHYNGVPICWWEWSRCDHSAHAERAARVTKGPWRTKPARPSARRDGSQREPFHREEPFHRSVR